VKKVTPPKMQLTKVDSDVFAVRLQSLDRAARRVALAHQRREKQGAHKIILDLRNCGRGPAIGRNCGRTAVSFERHDCHVACQTVSAQFSRPSLTK